MGPSDSNLRHKKKWLWTFYPVLRYSRSFPSQRFWRLLGNSLFMMVSTFRAVSVLFCPSLFVLGSLEFRQDIKLFSLDHKVMDAFAWTLARVGMVLPLSSVDFPNGFILWLTPWILFSWIDHQGVPLFGLHLEAAWLLPLETFEDYLYNRPAVLLPTLGSVKCVVF